MKANKNYYVYGIFVLCYTENTRENDFGIVGKQATITSASSAYFYVDPAMFKFLVTVISYAWFKVQDS
jgi:hypothetical protein